MSSSLSYDMFAHNSAKRLDRPSEYLLRKAKRSAGAQRELDACETSSTLYIGNMSFYTTEEQIYELFSKSGTVSHIIMGLDRFNKTPCGFCFVVLKTHAMAVQALRYLNKTKLDDRELTIDLDSGFKEGRQYGRGVSGGQVMDENRTNFDPGRGGYGKRWANAAAANGASMLMNYSSHV